MPPGLNTARLYSQLLLTGLSQKDQALYQVIRALIDAAVKLENTTFGTGGSSSGGGSSSITNNIINNLVQLSGNDGNDGEDGMVISLISGSGSSSSGSDYVVASDGATPIPSPLNDGFGNFIYVPYTP